MGEETKPTTSGLFDGRQLNRIEAKLLEVEGKLDHVLDNRYAEVLRALRRIEGEQKFHRTLLEKIMALADDLKAGIAELNDETTKVGDLITSLAGKIKNTMTDAEVADIKAALTGVGDHLKMLAVDPTVPVPPEPPPVTAAKKFAAKK